uniref:Uncharacterized protein n=1 Tax=Rhizophora mucronata TaxID=61149 RepID=A0A2P2NDY3_RHIMU
MLPHKTVNILFIKAVACTKTEDSSNSQPAKAKVQPDSANDKP